MGPEIDDDDTNATRRSQPCPALQGKRCRICASPGALPNVRARLLQDVRRGTVGVERARAQIVETRKRTGRVKRQMTRPGQSDGRLRLTGRCAEALAGAVHAHPQVNRKHAELKDTMSAVEELIPETFLDGRGPS
jgi:hypothetical protein